MVRPDQDPDNLDTLYQFIAEQFCTLKVEKKVQVLVHPAPYDPAFSRFFDALRRYQFTDLSKDETRALSKDFLDTLKTNPTCRTKIIAYTILSTPEWGAVGDILCQQEVNKRLPEMEKRYQAQYEAQIAKLAKQITVLKSDVDITKKNTMEFAKENQELRSKLAEHASPTLTPTQLDEIWTNLKNARNDYTDISRQLQAQKDANKKLEEEMGRWKSLSGIRDQTTKRNLELANDNYKKNETIKELKMLITQLEGKVTAEVVDIEPGIDYQKKYEELKQSLQGRDAVLKKYDEDLKAAQAELKKLRAVAEKISGTALIEYNLQLQSAVETLRTKLKLEESEQKKCQETLTMYKELYKKEDTQPQAKQDEHEAAGVLKNEPLEKAGNGSLPRMTELQAPSPAKSGPEGTLVYTFKDDYRRLELELHGPSYRHQTWTLFDKDDRLSNRMYGLYLLHQGEQARSGVYPNSIYDLKNFGLIDTSEDGSHILTPTGNEIVQTLQQQKPERFKDARPTKRIPSAARVDLSLIEQGDS